jgi:hypothetical protein
MKNIFCVTSYNSVGCSFIDWSVYFLTEQAEHYNVKLKPHQNIHHINGDKLDNRIENLELWDSSQPPGQRVEDKILFYKNLFNEYKNHPLYVHLF